MIILLGKAVEGNTVSWYYPRSSLASVQLTSKQDLGLDCLVLRLSADTDKLHAFWVTPASCPGDDVWSLLNSYMLGDTDRLVLTTTSWRLEEAKPNHTVITSSLKNSALDAYGTNSRKSLF